MSYTSEEPAADSRTWTLTGPRDGTVQLHSRHHSFTDASYKAVAHANSVREELTRRTVTDYRHPQFDARLQVVTNGATRMTEVVLNGRDGTTRLVLDTWRRPNGSVLKLGTTPHRRHKRPHRTDRGTIWF